MEVSQLGEETKAHLILVTQRLNLSGDSPSLLLCHGGFHLFSFLQVRRTHTCMLSSGAGPGLSLRVTGITAGHNPGQHCSLPCCLMGLSFSPGGGENVSKDVLTLCARTETVSHVTPRSENGHQRHRHRFFWGRDQRPRNPPGPQTAAPLLWSLTLRCPPASGSPAVAGFQTGFHVAQAGF